MTDKPDKPDDLEAVRKIIELLAPFAVGDQERIIRWAREKLGLPTQSLAGTEKEQASTRNEMNQREDAGGPKDIRTFVTEKSPSSDNQFAATVAYYYRFVAPEAAKKDSITADDLQQACRLTGRNRLVPLRAPEPELRGHGDPIPAHEVPRRGASRQASLGAS